MADSHNSQYVSYEDDGQAQQSGPRRGRRPSASRGLPTPKDCRKLARTWLEYQRRLWPKLVKAGHLPTVSDENIETLADAFEKRFLDGRVEPVEPPVNNGLPVMLGMSYVRYSDDNSNPRSLDDQLALQLELAAKHERFIPWPYVFADASVTATHRARRGYRLAKAMVKHDAARAADTLYIDEIGRASRDGIEALRLGRLIQAKQKRLVGVSDGFDSTEQFAQMKLHMFAMMNEWYVEQLRHKVNRGMNGAFRRGTSTGKAALGYKLVPCLDADGQPIFGQDGKQQKTYAIDETLRDEVVQAFTRFAEQQWSASRLAKDFNRRQVGGRTSWSASSITQLLRRRTYVGIRVFNRKRTTVDPETGERATVENPRRDWRVQRVRELQIVPWRLWKKTQHRLDDIRKNHPNTGRVMTADQRRDLYPTTLFGGILMCQDCQRPLVLRRSAGKYKQFYCPAYVDGRHGCTLTTSKSGGIIEPVLLNWLKCQLLGPDQVQQLVERANAYLLEEAARPKTDLRPLDERIEQTVSRRDRLVNALADGEEEDLPGVMERLRQLERDLAELRRERATLEAANAEVPPPLEIDDVMNLLDDVRALLEEDTPAAATAIRELTGPITVRQITLPGYKRPQWVAHVRGHVLPLLRKRANETHCPTALTLDLLCQRKWTMPIEVEIPLCEPPVDERIAPEVVALVEQGFTAKQIAQRLEVAVSTVRQAWKRKHPNRPLSASTEEAPVEQLAEAVARLRHEEELTFPEIGRRLGVSKAVAQRAHAHWHELHPDKEGDIPWPVLCRRPGRVSLATRRRICELSLSGWRRRDIVRQLGLQEADVDRVLASLRRAQAQRDS